MDAVGRILGAAFAVDRGHYVTCAHIVMDAGGQGPGDKIAISVPGSDKDVLTEVLPEGWTAPTDRLAGDFALLRALSGSGDITLCSCS